MMENTLWLLLILALPFAADAIGKFLFKVEEKEITKNVDMFPPKIKEKLQKVKEQKIAEKIAKEDKKYYEDESDKKKRKTTIKKLFKEDSKSSEHAKTDKDNDKNKKTNDNNILNAAIKTNQRDLNKI